jgi:geranylgeranylglycerol-phosphate geranylgeranyltransferase
MGTETDTYNLSRVGFFKPAPPFLIMLAYLELIRPGNCLMSLVAVAIGALLASGGNLTIFLDMASPVYLALLAVFLITGAGNAINDYLDTEADRVNKPRRPIPSGRLSARTVLGFSIILFAAGIALSGFLTWYALFIAVFNSALLVVYSYHLQNKILLGNIAIGYLVGSTFLFGGAALGSMFLPFLLFILAMFSTISREIVKDLEDLEGDRRGFLKRLASGAKRIAERFGTKGREAEFRIRKDRAKDIAILSMLAAIMASPLPYVLGVLGLPYLIILAPTVMVFLLSVAAITRAGTKKEFAKASRMIKLGMNLGLLAFIAGVLL